MGRSSKGKQAETNTTQSVDQSSLSQLTTMNNGLEGTVSSNYVPNHDSGLVTESISQEHASQAQQQDVSNEEKVSSQSDNNLRGLEKKISVSKTQADAKNQPSEMQSKADIVGENRGCSKQNQVVKELSLVSNTTDLFYRGKFVKVIFDLDYLLKKLESSNSMVIVVSFYKLNTLDMMSWLEDIVKNIDNKNMKLFCFASRKTTNIAVLDESLVCCYGSSWDINLSGFHPDFVSMGEKVGDKDCKKKLEIQTYLMNKWLNDLGPRAEFWKQISNINSEPYIPEGLRDYLAIIAIVISLFAVFFASFYS